MIFGVIIQDLRQIANEKGKVMHMLRCDSPLFAKFGEIYFSSISSGVVKAWKRHLKMTQHIAVPVGTIRLVIYDDRNGSQSFGELQTLEIGEDNYCLVRIPPLVWYGFKALSPVPALIANCTDLPHDPDEIETLDFLDHKIPYQWVP